MPAVTLVPADLAPFASIAEAKAQAMIDDALALAARVAPCILTAEFEHPAAAKAILRGAVLRWNEAGSGALSQESRQSGPFTHALSMDTRQQRRNLFWPSELEQLEDLCRAAGEPGSGSAFSIDTMPAGAGDEFWPSVGADTYAT